MDNKIKICECGYKMEFGYVMDFKVLINTNHVSAPSYEGYYCPKCDKDYPIEIPKKKRC